MGRTIEGIHILPPGLEFAGHNCRHTTAEKATRAEFRRLPRAKCSVPGCNKDLGVICPDCGKVY
jgi:hypothetical protein